MNISDAFDLGSSIVSAGRAIKAQNKLKAEHPDAYKCHLLLGKVCAQSPLNFTAVGTPEGQVLYRSEQLIRGFNQPEFKCYAFVMPDEHVIQFLYTPEFAQFVIENYEACNLLNWVNARLSIGRLFVSNTFTNRVGRQINQLAYGVEVTCNKVPDDQLEIVLRNVLDGILAFRDVFLPIIEPANELTLSFSSEGPVGQSAAQALEKYNQALAKRKSITLQGRQEQLEHRLASILGDVGYYNEKNTENQYFTVKPQLEGGGDFSLHIFANQYSQIVVQSYSPTLTENQYSAIMESDHILLANRNSGGNYHVSQKDQRVIYRTGVDARGIETIVHSEWVTQMIKIHLLAKQMYMPGFKDIKYIVLGETPEDVPTSFAASHEEEITPEIPDEVVHPVESSKPVTPAFKWTEPDDIPTESRKPAVGRQKSRTTALALEILPGLVGLLGFGWMYSGKKGVGLLILLGMVAVDIFALGTFVSINGLGCSCFFPIYLILIGLSAFLLNKYAVQHPEIFGS